MARPSLNPFARSARKSKATRGPSRLERRFSSLWKAVGGPPLQAEVRFHPTRRWRADFHHPESRTLIEIEGGVFMGGRHTRGAGYVSDCEKYLEAWHLGFAVVRLTSPQINRESLSRIAAKLRAQTRSAPSEGGLSGNDKTHVS